MEIENQAHVVSKSKEHEEENHKQLSKTAKLCEECEEKEFKYKCPACSLRSCSLPCVKAHKLRTGCSGVRSRTHFVPLSQFDDKLLLSDYNLLEEVKRVAESARRTRTKLPVHPYFKLPYHLHNLRRAASARRTQLLLLPKGMSRREKNQSSYDPRKNFISWTIEWRFHSTDVVLLDHGVQEDTNLSSAIEKHMKPGPWMNPLRQFCQEELHSLNFHIRKCPKGPKSHFIKLDAGAPLKQQLANVVVLEYPVIHISLPSHSHHFGVVKELHSVAKKPETCNSNNNIPSPKGVSFREEEIEDNDSTEPHVFDVMNQAKGSSSHSMPRHKMDEKSSDKSPSNASLTKVEGDCNIHFASNSVEFGDFDDLEFDFDQGLMEAYSDLMTDLIPDDFLDFEGTISLNTDLEENKDSSHSKRVTVIEQELEEGEIAE